MFTFAREAAAASFTEVNPVLRSYVGWMSHSSFHPRCSLTRTFQVDIRYSTYKSDSDSCKSALSPSLSPSFRLCSQSAFQLRQSSNRPRVGHSPPLDSEPAATAPGWVGLRVGFPRRRGSGSVSPRSAAPASQLGSTPSHAAPVKVTGMRDARDGHERRSRRAREMLATGPRYTRDGSKIHSRRARSRLEGHQHEW